LDSQLIDKTLVSPSIVNWEVRFRKSTIQINAS